MPLESAFDRKKLHQSKRQAIIREAARAFNENGYEGTSLDAVADRLGVTKKALYYYVKSKQEILTEIFRQWGDAQESAIDEAERQDCSAIERLELYAHLYVRKVFETLTPVDRIVGELSSLDEKEIRRIKARRKELDGRLAGFVEQAIREGRATKHDPEIVIKVIDGAIDWMFKWFKPSGPRSLDEEVSAVMSVLMFGVLKR